MCFKFSFVHTFTADQGSVWCPCEQGNVWIMWLTIESLLHPQIATAETYVGYIALSSVSTCTPNFSYKSVLFSMQEYVVSCILAMYFVCKIHHITRIVNKCWKRKAEQSLWGFVCAAATQLLSSCAVVAGTLNYVMAWWVQCASVSRLCMIMPKQYRCYWMEVPVSVYQHMLHNKYALHSIVRVMPLKGSPIVGVLCTFPFLLRTWPVGRPHNYRGTKLLSYRLPWVVWASTMCCNDQDSLRHGSVPALGSGSLRIWARLMTCEHTVDMLTYGFPWMRWF